MPLFKKFWKTNDSDDSSGDECEDASASSLSYVGTAIYNVLRRHHNHHHRELWNVTTAKVVGPLQFTPRDAFTRPPLRVDPPPGHDDWFPRKIGDMIRKTRVWCDILTLSPPDGMFLTEIQEALRDVCVNMNAECNRVLGGCGVKERIIVRIMFANIVAMPVNCHKLIQTLTSKLPPGADQMMQLWVGSWRKDATWNHAKIIAVDGLHLWTGGHNFWDPHYLQTQPVNDLSLEMEGGVARDAHRFANAQWGYILKKQDTVWGRFVNDTVSDTLDVPRRARVTISEYPPGGGTAEYPPRYSAKAPLHTSRARTLHDRGYVPCISMGRYGCLLKTSRPSDDGIVAMLSAAQDILRLSLQDLGPVAVPGTQMALPGFTWPYAYLDALATVIWEKGVDVEIVLSNPHSIPGGLSSTEANYGNGWNCVDVASEIIKRIQKLFPDAGDGELRRTVNENLRVCFLRSPHGRHYSDGSTLGLHSKHFIVDDRCCYIGSQNLYLCDLAEWGVVIDHAETTRSIKAQYWDPMWNCSYREDDCEVRNVMDGLNIRREAANRYDLTKLQLTQAQQKMEASKTNAIEKVNQATQQLEVKMGLASEQDAGGNGDDGSSNQTRSLMDRGNRPSMAGKDLIDLTSHRNVSDGDLLVLSSDSEGED